MIHNYVEEVIFLGSRKAVKSLHRGTKGGGVLDPPMHTFRLSLIPELTPYTCVEYACPLNNLYIRSLYITREIK